MPVTELRVGGYRSIFDLEIPLKQANIIVGPNGCGKSNLYHSVSLLRSAAEGNLSKRIGEEGGMPSILWAGGRKEGGVRIHLGVTLDEFEYDLEIGLPYDPKSAFILDPLVKSETILIKDKKRKVTLLERKAASCHIVDVDGVKENFYLSLDQSESVLSQIVDTKKYPILDELRRRMLLWRFYHGFRTDAESPIRRPQIGVRTRVLSADGVDLAAALQTINENGNDLALKEAINDAFPGAELIINSDLGNFEACMCFPGIERPMRARELSDGTLRYLCLVAALMTLSPAPLLALNEPETSLHPSVLKPLARLISRAAARSQIWLTTHSSLLADAISEEMVVSPIALHKVDGRTMRADRPAHLRFAVEGQEG